MRSFMGDNLQHEKLDVEDGMKKSVRDSHGFG